MHINSSYITRITVDSPILMYIIISYYKNHDILYSDNFKYTSIYFDSSQYFHSPIRF